jgi:glutaredoxin 3
MYKIYGKDWCVYCDRAKVLLTSKGLPYVYYDIEKDEDVRNVALEKSGGQKKVPIIFDTNDNHVGGFDELRISLKV